MATRHGQGLDCRGNRVRALSFERLEDRIVLSESPPPVIFLARIELSEGWGTLSPGGRTIYWPPTGRMASDSISHEESTDLILNPERLSGYSRASIVGSDGHISFETEVLQSYYPAQSGPSSVSAYAEVGVYVLGGPGTPYALTLDTTYEAPSRAGNWDGFENIQGDRSEMGYSTNLMTDYNGYTYSAINLNGGLRAFSYLLWPPPSDSPPVTAHLMARWDVSVTNLAVPDIKMIGATMTDRDVLTYSYSISTAALPSPVTVGIYRSSDAKFDPETDVRVGTTQLPLTAVGQHVGTWRGSHPIDPAYRHVLVVADPSNSVAEQDGDPLNEDNTASFRKWTIGAITHGYQPRIAGVTPYPAWMDEMAGQLQAVGYDVTLTHDWSATSNLAAPGHAVAQGRALATRIAQTAGTLRGQVAPQDVLDLHAIGHSRGAVVIDQALDILGGEVLGRDFHGGYLKMTMLDPFPANNGTRNRFRASGLGRLFVPSFQNFVRLASDPGVGVPNRVDKAESFFQDTPNADANDDIGRHFNLHGLDNIARASNYNVRRDEPGVSHTTIHDWYTRTRVPRLRNILRP